MQCSGWFLPRTRTRTETCVDFLCIRHHLLSYCLYIDNIDCCSASHFVLGINPLFQQCINGCLKVNLRKSKLEVVANLSLKFLNLESRFFTLESFQFKKSKYSTVHNMKAQRKCNQFSLLQFSVVQLKNSRNGYLKKWSILKVNIINFLRYFSLR